MYRYRHVLASTVTVVVFKLLTNLPVVVYVTLSFFSISLPINAEHINTTCRTMFRLLD